MNKGCLRSHSSRQDSKGAEEERDLLSDTEHRIGACVEITARFPSDIIIWKILDLKEKQTLILRTALAVLSPSAHLQVSAQSQFKMCAIVLLLLLATSLHASDPLDEKALPKREGWRAPSCVRCCGPAEQPASITASRYARMTSDSFYSIPRIRPTIDITILKGEKGEMGDRGVLGPQGKAGEPGQRGHPGRKGQKGQPGLPGDSCKQHYVAFSVARRKALHSNDYYQHVTFDTELVNLHQHFNMFTGRFFCYVPGIYFFILNVHTWNYKETYLHIMKNEEEAAILYSQPSERSIMQSQSLMLSLQEGDEVWVRMFKRERENGIYGEESDIYITFNGHLIKPEME